MKSHQARQQIKASLGSQNEAVVKVDSAGGLTALAAGTATITVTSKAKSSIKATLEVTVNAVQVDVASVTVTGNTEVGSRKINYFNGSGPS